MTIDKPGAAEVATEDAAVAWKAVRKRSVTDLLSTGFIGQKGDEGMRAGRLRCRGRGISWRQAE